ncbi:hypothetical protein B0H63DRAFT_509558 [Podospora didyma]|uniref:3-hydroxyacyl-CoA dehydrogenase n=1 Tax=Podospora didyma TaxID=330526 RepID=A0AAE0NU93_9PEZI|nr:hypothetical protein B0H63DRAFT_509558 [Podospora didyma]
MKTPIWSPPRDYRRRPVTILGAGVLGRRVATCWLSGGYDVHIRDPSAQQLQDCLAYASSDLQLYLHNASITPGTLRVFESLPEALESAWLVIEAVPEKLPLKIDTFAQLEALAPADAILATNSSSYKSSEMLDKVGDATRARILNTHYYMPPAAMAVELMTDGYTHPEIFPFLADRQREAGTNPYIARKESTGLIFNRLWAAVKREVLTILAEGVSVPEEIDGLWSEVMSKGGAGPCKMMDMVGLDTVAFIEEHYIRERGLSPAMTVDYLRREYVDQGKLGAKSLNGGLYPPKQEPKTAAPPPSSEAQTQGPNIYALETGLASASPSFTSGQILELSPDGKVNRVIASGQALPDGIAIDPAVGRLFWANMGNPTANDGAVYSCTLDGGDIRQVLAPGLVHTPKQLAVEPRSQTLYFSDREGLRVLRCKYDGSDLETLVQTGDFTNPADAADQTKWCVGIAVSPTLKKFYWTQKGPSKGGQGRIFCADISTPLGSTPSTRPDVTCLLQNLPEPIDLEIDEATNTLYWTDRGELPFGNSLNRIQLGDDGLLLDAKAAAARPHVMTRNFHETIGLKLDAKNGHVYVSDLGGAIYRCDLSTGKKTTLVSGEEWAFTGITIL